MTDYTDLIARLRYTGIDDEAEAADALEAQARRIAELEYDARYHECNDEVMMRDIDYYRARIAELEAALKPFADEYDMHEPGKFPDDFYVDLETGLTIGQFRAARAALEKKNEHD